HNADGDDLFHRAVRITVEAFDGSLVRTRIGAELGSSFFLTVVHLVYLRPLRPRIVRGTVHRRLGHDLDLCDALAAVAHRRGHTVGAGVAAANHDDTLAARMNRARIGITVEKCLGAGGHV